MVAWHGSRHLKKAKEIPKNEEFCRIMFSPESFSFYNNKKEEKQNDIPTTG